MKSSSKKGTMRKTGTDKNPGANAVKKGATKTPKGKVNG